MGTIKVKVDIELEDLIPGYLENRNKDIVTLRNSISSSDYDQVKTIGHQIKGNSGSYGFDDMGKIGAGIETACQNNEHDKIPALVDELEAYLKEIDIEYVEME